MQRLWLLRVKMVRFVSLCVRPPGCLPSIIGYCLCSNIMAYTINNVVHVNDQCTHQVKSQSELPPSCLGQVSFLTGWPATFFDVPTRIILCLFSLYVLSIGVSRFGIIFLPSRDCVQTPSPFPSPGKMSDLPTVNQNTILYSMCANALVKMWLTDIFLLLHWLNELTHQWHNSTVSVQS